MMNSRKKDSRAALAVVVRIWIVSLAILSAPALAAGIVGLGQCKDIACPAGASQTAGYIAR
jgi:hypothetical protein